MRRRFVLYAGSGVASGLLGPAWAQEGIAMNIARETWWQERRWYVALLDHPASQ